MSRSRPILALILCLVAALVLPASPGAALEPRHPEAEALAQRLVDCTRSGGWVQADGTCDADDAEDRVPRRKALLLSQQLSDELARPYARRLARAGYLSHYLGGSIRERFSAIGMGDGRVGENLGYAGGLDPLAAVLRIHRLFQAEWSYDGWHWRNLTDRRFGQVGIGVWVRKGRTYLVYDFQS